MDDASRRKLQLRIQSAWREKDAHALVEIEPREDGKIAVRVESTAFVGMDSFQREALFWPVMRDLPNDVLVRMTYSLLLTPDEASRYFEGEPPVERIAI